MFKKLNEALTEKNIGVGYLYFYIHFICEIVCFYMLGNLLGDSVFLWFCPLIYDALAFVPQGVIGYISDKFPKLKMGIIGIVFLCLALLMDKIVFIKVFPMLKYLPIIIVAIGNAFIHVNGAEVTLRASNGKLSHSAIFVAGGSFGVITGKVLAKFMIPSYVIFVLTLTAIPFVLLAEYYRKSADKNALPCSNFNYANPNLHASVVIALAVLVVFVRSYMGYGLPTSWNKTLVQTIILYFAMGFGKALGGILSDAYGIRKVATISTVLSLPFLLFGDNIMIISIIGVMLFSMTMAITLGLIVSELKSAPGLAFGFTTIGLFLGFAPTFFFKLSYGIINNLIISFLTLVCWLILLKILRKESENDG